MNDKFFQLKGPFKANQDLVQLIETESAMSYIKKLGIQSIPSHKCNINNKVFEIGKTDLLEFDDVMITSLFFLQEEPESTLVDCVLE